MSGASAMDEMVDGNGHLRPQWRDIMASLTSLGDTMPERMRRLDAAFEEEGITSVLPGATTAGNTWRCDPIPLPLSAREFASLEAGLTQRAELLNAILEDIYGPQTLLASGAIPPALVFANPGFLRLPAGSANAPMIHHYAADMARGPDGGWRVYSDRTNAPSGAGYARENRRLLNRVVPEAFRPVQVRQLRPFFEIWQDSMQRMAPAGKTNPGVALLTPGTGDSQWFEHMYLARELSCALVEAGDLTVRAGGVFLKTLKGLQPVDVLLRRIEGRSVDPLELDQHNSIGVAGLLDAARAGSVRISNDPGSGAAEAPGLAAFLPDLCLRLRDERLLMPSVPTLWLGDARALEMFQADPSRYLIRSALDGRAQAMAPAKLSDTALAELMAKIAHRPWAYAAATAVAPSVAPCVTTAGLQPKPIVLRLFLVSSGARWHAMEGGLARVVDDGQLVPGRLPRIGLSKDVWVLSEDRVDIVGPASPPQPMVRIKRSHGDLPSRVADNMFWLGRYIERLDRAARLMRATVGRLARTGTLLPRELAEVQILARCLIAATVVSGDIGASASSTAPLVQAMLASVRERGNLDVMFAEVTRLTEAVRDRLTGDMYATFTQTLRSARSASSESHTLDALSHAMIAVLRFCSSVSGVASENMVRGGGFLFLDLGRRLERARAVTTEVSNGLDQPPARIELGLRLILELCDSAITYRNRYLTVLQPAPVLDLVLADPSNPRGLAFQLTAAHEFLEELADGTDGHEMLAGIAAGLLAEAEMLVETVMEAPDQAEAAAAAAAKLRAIGQNVAALSDRINRRYFALLPAIQTVGWTTPPSELRGAA